MPSPESMIHCVESDVADRAKGGDTRRRRGLLQRVSQSRKLRMATAIGNVAVMSAIVMAAAPVANGAGSPFAAQAAIFPASSLVAVLAVMSGLSAFLLLSGGRRRRKHRPIELPIAAGARSPMQPLAEVGTGVVASMSHELRTPLNAIIGFSEIMQQQLYGPLGSERYESYARHIRDSGEQLLVAIEGSLVTAAELAERPTVIPGAAHLPKPARGVVSGRPLNGA